MKVRHNSYILFIDGTRERVHYVVRKMETLLIITDNNTYEFDRISETLTALYIDDSREDIDRLWKFNIISDGGAIVYTYDRDLEDVVSGCIYTADQNISIRQMTDGRGWTFMLADTGDYWYFDHTTSKMYIIFSNDPSINMNLPKEVTEIMGYWIDLGDHGFGFKKPAPEKIELEDELTWHEVRGSIHFMDGHMEII